MRRRRTAIAILAAVGSLAALTPTAAAHSGTARCNGSAALCARTLGDVAFATTHNSMASSADGFRPPNQRRSMHAQLEHGIRGFQIDAYLGAPRRGRVYTDIAEPLDTSDVPAPLVAAAMRIHRALGAPPPGTPFGVYLCHVFCELGEVKMVDQMRVVRRFLDAHPREVVVIVVEDHVPADRLQAVLQEAGLGPMLLPDTPGTPLPTLEQMIDAGTRVEISLENGDGGTTLPNAFAGLVQETPFTFLRPRNLEAAASCSTNRGTPDGPVFQLNHWVTPAEPLTAARVNSSVLRARLARCEEARGRGPTLVAVDFAERGDLLAIVRELNR